MKTVVEAIQADQDPPKNEKLLQESAYIKDVVKDLQAEKNEAPNHVLFRELASVKAGLQSLQANQSASLNDEALRHELGPIKTVLEHMRAKQDQPPRDEILHREVASIQRNVDSLSAEKDQAPNHVLLREMASIKATVQNMRAEQSQSYQVDTLQGEVVSLRALVETMQTKQLRSTKTMDREFARIKSVVEDLPDKHDQRSYTETLGKDVATVKAIVETGQAKQNQSSDVNDVTQDVRALGGLLRTLQAKQAQVSDTSETLLQEMASIRTLIKTIQTKEDACLNAQAGKQGFKGIESRIELVQAEQREHSAADARALHQELTSIKNVIETVQAKQDQDSNQETVSVDRFEMFAQDVVAATGHHTQVDALKSDLKMIKDFMQRISHDGPAVPTDSLSREPVHMARLERLPQSDLPMNQSQSPNKVPPVARDASTTQLSATETDHWDAGTNDDPIILEDSQDIAASPTESNPPNTESASRNPPALNPESHHQSHHQDKTYNPNETTHPPPRPPYLPPPPNPLKRRRTTSHTSTNTTLSPPTSTPATNANPTSFSSPPPFLRNPQGLRLKANGQVDGRSKRFKSLTSTTSHPSSPPVPKPEHPPDRKDPPCARTIPALSSTHPTSPEEVVQSYSAEPTHVQTRRRSKPRSQGRSDGEGLVLGGAGRGGRSLRSARRKGWGGVCANWGNGVVGREDENEEERIGGHAERE